MGKKEIHDYIGDITYDPKQFEVDVETIRAYCKDTNCEKCILRQNGLDACRTMETEPHPLDDPAYVTLCMEALKGELNA